jgi:2-succinyl-6-hydroxy-2,4-cyclohexadiene-1-carboxylate synthase
MPLTERAASRFATLPAICMHYLEWDGTEPAIVLLHPNRTNARVFDFVVEHCSLNRRFIAPDQRGHGLSDYPGQSYLYDDYLGDTEALLAALGLDSVHLVGAAPGGNLALLLASRRPALVRTLTVIDPGLSLDPALSARVREQMVKEFRFAALTEARARTPFSARWTEEMKDHFSAHSFRALDDGSVEWLYFPPGVVETEQSLETPLWDRSTCAARR